jgi:putative spermidine/putrescine transport system permease protein
MDHDRSLGQALKRIERRRALTPVALVAPLVVFIVFTFVIPLAGVAWRSVNDGDVARALPRTIAALQSWSGRELPQEVTYRALIADLREAREAGSIPLAATRLNYALPGFRTLIFKTVRSLPNLDMASPKTALIALDPEWANLERWGAIRHAAGPIGIFYFLAAVDLRQEADGTIVRQPTEEAIYQDVFLRTFEVSFGVMLICLVLGFPLAYHLASLPQRIANPLMILVLIPFWTSMLVRTSAWIVLLQRNGPVNDLLVALHLLHEPAELIYNRSAVYIAMTHVLLPFMVLPLYSAMRGISPSYMRAASSLGAGPLRCFLRVYLPLCMAGVGSGCLLVFILATGYYILPALVGGGGDRMVSYFIAYFTNSSANWGMASAMSVVLLAITLVLFFIYVRLSGTSRVKLG